MLGILHPDDTNPFVSFHFVDWERPANTQREGSAARITIVHALGLVDLATLSHP